MTGRPRAVGMRRAWIHSWMLAFGGATTWRTRLEPPAAETTLIGGSFGYAARAVRTLQAR